MKAIIGEVIASGASIGRRAVCYDGGQIVNILNPDSSALADIEVEDFGDAHVSAGFIDIHFNGAGGRVYQFCDNKNETDQIFAALASVGTVYGLPVISATDIEEYRSVRDSSRAYRKLNGQLLGLNFEGPFINPKKVGFGRADCVGDYSPNYFDVYYDLLDDMKVMMTIDPESVDTLTALQMIKDGVILSFGHSNAGSGITRDYVELGVRHSTHLFNGMPPIAGRAPGLTGVCLSSPEVAASIILDGHHLAKETVSLIWAIKPSTKICTITDGMPPLGSDVSSFNYRDTEIKFDEAGALLDQSGNLSGTGRSQLEMCKLLKEWTGDRVDRIVDTVTRAPALAIGLNNLLGDIRVGMAASFTVFDDDFTSVATIFEGQRLD